MLIDLKVRTHIPPHNFRTPVKTGEENSSEIAPSNPWMPLVIARRLLVSLSLSVPYIPHASVRVVKRPIQMSTALRNVRQLLSLKAQLLVAFRPPEHHLPQWHWPRSSARHRALERDVCTVAKEAASLAAHRPFTMPQIIPPKSFELLLAR